MKEKIPESAKQFKLLDDHFVKEIRGRKDVMSAAKEEVTDRVRSDQKAKYNEVIRHATLQVLSKDTRKRKERGTEMEIWTVPL
jgi:hypothetical protein